MRIDRFRQPQTVDGMNEEESVRGFHFVALEMSDEVPVNWRTARRHLAERLLYAVFADVMQTGSPRGCHRVRSVRLGDGDDSCALAMPTAPGGFVDSLPNLCETVWQVLEWHNALKYQGLQIESSETTEPFLFALPSNFAGHCSIRIR